jgi:pantoate--beta-alanine ligase
MKIIKKIKEMQAWSDHGRLERKKIGFVPTMGYLHEGHLSLMRIAREVCDLVVVSIFVNPSQFAPHEDFNAYPRDLQRDFEMSKKEGVDILFAPEVHEIYPEGFQTYVSLEKIPMHLCGLSRPIFFRGVATVVTKLFNIIKPHTAVFGKKDYQQFLVIRRMAYDLHMDIKIIGAETIREHDGLAMSSRNIYLTNAQRTSALSLNKALKAAQTEVESGTTDASQLIRKTKEFINSHPETQIDYVAICDPETLEEIQIINPPVLMALAVKVGSTRLIDNMILNTK